MPTYAYRCKSCGHTFDKVQKITGPPRARCPRCKGRAERRITGGGGFLLKGEGFHATDYRSESYKQGAKSESGGDATAHAKPATEPAAGSPAETGAKAKGGAASKPKPGSEASSKPKGGRHKPED